MAGGTLQSIITKPPESGVLCDNITEFVVAKDHLSPYGEGDLPGSPEPVRLR